MRGLRSSERTKPLIEALYEAQNKRCASCGDVMFLPSLHPVVVNNTDYASIDHLWARSIGGSDDITNKVAMHRRCNSHKKHRHPTGCELIFHAVVLAKLDMVEATLVRRTKEMLTFRLGGTGAATLGDIWPIAGETT